MSSVKVGGVASAALADLLSAPPQPAELVASFPMAIYVRAAGRVVALVNPDGVRLPNAIVVPRAEHSSLGRHVNDGAIHVGDGAVRIGPVVVTAGRWWDPVPRLGRLDVDTIAARVDVVRSLLPEWPPPDGLATGRLRMGRDLLADALARNGDVASAAGALVGLGPGLTPAGDDLLAGAMAGLVVFGTALKNPAAVAVAQRLRSAVLEHSAATTILAADLAEHAARGALVIPAADLCRAIADPRPEADRAIPMAVERLIRLGHTSGRDLAEGLLLGVSTAVSRSSGHDTPESGG